ncbi:hypothetical protein BALOs_0984 [Halobacteriovorax sp. BALOs_7]|uniref:hypothetical protein n=1 Tax=unclassified Halobacteriovorax TaxID=2639665 RepID=UPI000EA3DCD8|nr:hypothetical protein [Halobacteriovorax sp. BALOs_7]AYF43994.1 hypothetical protein BALOs_0984 [Halobacteriovorax sp. BALOs_7]
MKSIILSALIFVSLNTLAGLTPKRKELYHCVNYDMSSKVTDAIIYESRFGRNTPFHEVEVFVDDLNQNNEYSFIKKVNYIPKYNKKVESFTTGNFRFRLDHVAPGINGNIWTFARVPEHGVHSFDWSCKDIKENK